MSLKEYKNKRNFKETSEPKRSGNQQEEIFVVQKHDATTLHFDFRIKVGRVLKSWAIPRQPSSKYGEKRLAVQTEDHPLEYANFEGTIPRGNYGAGTVKIWDKGEYKNIRKISMQESFEQGQIEINLKGKKLKGNFTLIQTKFNNNPKNWLFIKTKDDKYNFDNG